MPCYIVDSMSRTQLRFLANGFRQYLGLKDVLWIPIVELLDTLPERFSSFSYEIVEDSQLPENIHAKTDVVTGHVIIKESIYERACKGMGRDRMTIAHEIAHYYMLHLCGFQLHRRCSNHKPKAYSDPEWQAKCFAGEFMISHNLTAHMIPAEIAHACGVSYEAAVYQYSHR